jgi:hypothetical protein
MIQQHRRIDQRDFFWLANNTGKAQDCRIVLHSIRGGISIWDCETGLIRPCAAQITEEGSVVNLKFTPYEAFWLVCNPTDECIRVPKPKEESKTIAELNGLWQVRIDAHAQPPLEHEPNLPAEFIEGVQRPLQDWEKWELKRFSGYVDYTKTFELDHEAGKTVLDLGGIRHLCQVWINGIDMGSRLWPPFTFDITDAVKPGRNTVKVRVGNLTNNNYGQKAESGLFGPVQIRQIETR